MIPLYVYIVDNIGLGIVISVSVSVILMLALHLIKSTKRFTTLSFLSIIVMTAILSIVVSQLIGAIEQSAPMSFLIYRIVWTVLLIVATVLFIPLTMEHRPKNHKVRSYGGHRDSSKVYDDNF